MCDNCGCGEERNSSSGFMPDPATLKTKTVITDADTLFEFEMENRSLDFLPGQFIIISLPGIGEVSSAISSCPSEGKNFQIISSNTNAVTNALQLLEPGAKIGVTGPLGNSFPLNNLKDKKLLFIVEGYGFVSTHSAIQYVLQHRDNYQSLTVLLANETPSHRLFTDELAAWKKSDKMYFLETVKQTRGAGWKGEIGNITTLLEKLSPLSLQDTYVVIAGPSGMYKTVIKCMYDLNIPDEHMIVNLQQRIKCGVGKCSECSINGIKVCLKGPVFYYHQIRDLKEIN